MHPAQVFTMLNIALNPGGKGAVNIEPVEVESIPGHPPLILPQKEYESLVEWARNEPEHSWSVLFAKDIIPQGYLVLSHYPMHGPASTPKKSERKRVDSALRNLGTAGFDLKAIYAHNHSRYAPGIQSNDIESIQHLIKYEMKKEELVFDVHVIVSGEHDTRAYIYLEGDFYFIPVKIKKFTYPIQDEDNRKIFETYYVIKKETEGLILESLAKPRGAERDAVILPGG